MPLAYVNGTITPIERATVNVEDRCLQFADGLYEVIRAYGGRLFRLGPHLDRMRQGMAALDLPEPRTPAGLEALLEELRERSGEPDGQLYVQLTRGTAPRSHVPPPDMEPTLIVTYRAAAPVPEERYREGARAITHADVRWQWCHLKTTALVANVALRTLAHRAGAYECLLHRDGLVTEATSSNVFAVIDGVLRTSPRSERILSGVTRAAVLEVAERLGLPRREEAFSLEEVSRAEELFVTGTMTEVMPVVVLDGRPVGDGRPGPITRRLQEAYRDLVRSETAG